MRRLDGSTVAILAADGFDDDEPRTPRRELRAAGAEVDVLSIRTDPIRVAGSGRRVAVDGAAAAAEPALYDALVLPGGAPSSELLRREAAALELVPAFAADHKPIAAVGDGARLLVDAGLVRGRRATNAPPLRAAPERAGARWSDGDAVADDGLITSRGPADLAAFCRTSSRVLGSASSASSARVG